MPSTALAGLERKRGSLHQAIGAAAAEADTEQVLILSEQLRSVDSTLAEYARLEARAAALIGDGEVDPQPASGGSRGRRKRIPGRGHGVEIRTDFLERALKHGVDLEPIRGSVYEGPGGLRMGIAVATERRADRWFLGLPEGRFDAAVLLCRDDAGKTIDVCLSQSFIAKWVSALSKSGGQVKFNVVRRNRSYFLLVPRAPEVDLGRCIGAIGGIAS